MEEYRLVLESQLGPREGVLRLEGAGNAVRGTLTLLGFENPVSGAWVGENSLELSHSLHTAVSDLACFSVFEMKGDKVVGTLRNDRNLMRWHGEKVPAEKGGRAEHGGK